MQHELRARLIGSIGRDGGAKIRFLRVMPEETTPAVRADAERALQRLADDEAPGRSESVVVCTHDLVEAVAQQAEDTDLVILGAQRVGGKKALGDITRQIAARISAPTVLISKNG